MLATRKFIFISIIFLIAGVGSVSAAPFSKIQSNFLDCLQRETVPVSIYLINGIKLQGIIGAFDASVIILNNSVKELVYQNSISYIAPAGGVCAIN